MIDYQCGHVIFECDSCQEVLETEQACFSSAWNLAKRQRWRAKKLDEEWFHVCPSCQIR